MQHSAYFFGCDNGVDLYAVIHGEQLISDQGVIFCHPLGEEKQKSYRTFYEFSKFLATHGIPSLRFDARGSGDSDGEMGTCNIETQVEDTRSAITQFLERTQVKDIVLIGTRLGASVASLTAEVDTRIKALGLMSPIVDGSRYWRELLRTQQFSHVSRSEKPKKSSELMKELKATGEIEIEAQLLGISLVDQLQAINLLDSVRDFKGEVLCTSLANNEIVRNDTQSLASKYSQIGCRTVFWPHEEREYWTNQSMYDAYAPLQTFEKFREWMHGWSA